MTSDPTGLSRAMTRRSFVRGAAGVAGLPLAVRGAGQVAAQPARAKPFAGKTLNVFMFDHPYPRALKELLPQFTELTGIKVKRPKIEVTDENVQQAMTNLREQQGTLVPIEDRGVEESDPA